MTLKDLVFNNLIKDNDEITISKPLIGNACDMRNGNWYNDNIVNFLDSEIQAFSWSEDGGYSIALK